MKKNLIYTVAFLLCGAFFFSSCHDMLNVDSDRVEYEFDGWTANDSVYSVLGILKSVQNVADRQILLNELRGDLLTLSEDKAVLDVQEIANFNYSNPDNQYIDARDYYTVINNCNIFLARVDTTLKKDGDLFMLPEFVAVKSMRAWTYLQLAINYNEIPFFIEPILTHSAATNVMNQAKMSRDQVIDKLIEDILPYENPSVYTMPEWTIPAASGAPDVKTEHRFFPIRMLLGEMYLWRGKYREAAQCFYNQITGANTNMTAPVYFDNRNVAKYSDEKGKSPSLSGYANLFATDKYSSNASVLALVTFASSALNGETISDLSNVFAPEGQSGASQVFASPGFVSLARRQMYCYTDRYAENKFSESPKRTLYGEGYEYPGDLRIKATTYSQMGNDEQNTEYENIVAKFNFSGSWGGLHFNYIPNAPTTLLMLQRAELAYLRLAEALVGLEREGYVKNKLDSKSKTPLEVAMAALKEGLKDRYLILKDPVYGRRDKLDENGNPIRSIIGYEKDENGAYKRDENGKLIPIYGEPQQEDYIVSADSVMLDFSDNKFDVNEGLHSRGSGDSKYNKYYQLDKLCIGRYLGCVEKDGDKEIVTVEFTKEDSLNYVSDLLLDELALELSWEGYRFGDLIRFAKSMDDPAVLAKRVAGRGIANKSSYRTVDYQMDGTLYDKLYNDETYWYLPLPDEIVNPADDENKE